MGRTVELRIAGQNFRVVSTASAEHLEHLAAIVDQKMTEVAPGRGDGAQRMLLVAMALAHDVEQERGRGEALRSRAGEFLRRLLVRVDSALAGASAARPDAGTQTPVPSRAGVGGAEAHSGGVAPEGVALCAGAGVEGASPTAATVQTQGR